ncbi:MAG TPA: GNAT family N-acetyltransferase [Isosphaeraceae bacterium]|nr:GNAT family N-acetyltransferase [Isosphaeraceae bacterium]
MPRLQLREAKPTDAEVLVHLVHEAFEQYRGRLVPPSGAHHETADNVGSRIQIGLLGAVLALADGQAVGCVFYEDADDHLVLSRLAVRPEQRRQGLAGRCSRRLKTAPPRGPSGGYGLAFGLCSMSYGPGTSTSATGRSSCALMRASPSPPS